jgi:CrcB protein
MTTFIINLSGAFLIGLLFSLAGQKVITARAQLVLATGFLGGYTTFSTFSWEALQLWRRANLRVSLLYLIGSMVLGLGAVAAGLALGTVVVGHSWWL